MGKKKRVQSKNEIVTPFGTWKLRYRSIVAVSVVQTTHECRHRNKRLAKGEYTIVEHRHVPTYRALINSGWCRHVKTYDVDGKPFDLLG